MSMTEIALKVWSFLVIAIKGGGRFLSTLLPETIMYTLRSRMDHFYITHCIYIKFIPVFGHILLNILKAQKCVSTNTNPLGLVGKIDKRQPSRTQCLHLILFCTVTVAGVLRAVLQQSRGASAPPSSASRHSGWWVLWLQLSDLVRMNSTSRCKSSVWKIVATVFPLPTPYSKK